MSALHRWALAGLLLLHIPLAMATISCTTPTSSGITTAYATNGTITNITHGTASFTCTRSSTSDATSILLRSSNGTNAAGTQNRIRLGTSLINYEAYQDSTCATLWTSNVSTAFKPVTLTATLSAQPLTVDFWVCIPPGQAGNTGIYTDTVGTLRVIRASGTGNLSPSGNFSISVNVPASCTVPSSLSTLAFSTYKAFQTTNGIGSTSIDITCTSKLPYRLTLDAYVGVFPGNNLQYRLDVDGASGSVDGLGSGSVQSHTINGSIPAGQAGQCTTGSCSGTAARTITVTW